MDVFLLYGLFLLAVAVPVFVYCLRVRPEIGREHIPEIIFGALTAVACMIPSGMLIPLPMGYMIIGMIAAAVLLIGHWALWLTAAIRKRPAGKLTRLSAVLPLLIWTNCAFCVVAWFFIIPYALRVITAPKE